jgi:NAD(P)-dependent dehydrogenase (short-subunit alcohol dehydrogenase family)
MRAKLAARAAESGNMRAKLAGGPDHQPPILLAAATACDDGRVTPLPDRSPKVALVTGGNAGIGLAVCRALTRLNVEVVVGARNADRGAAAVEQLGVEGMSVGMVLLDVTDDLSVAAAAQNISQRWGRLDILVNNAAVKHEFHPALPSETPVAVVKETFETNVFGTIRVIQAMLPLLRRSPGGRIVNVTSTLGSLSRALDPAAAQFPVTLLGYNSSKSAVNAVTVLFANELRQTPVKVNAVDPGGVNTPMNPRATRTADEAVAPIVRLALIDSTGPTGGYFDEHGSVPW